MTLLLFHVSDSTSARGGGEWEKNIQANVTLGGLSGDELLPSISALTDNVQSVLLVLALAGEGELVLGLSVRDLVNTEPLVGGTEETRQVTLDVLNVVQLGGERVVDVDDNDLPVRLLLVKQGHDTKDLDLLDLAGVADQFTDLTNVQRVVVTLGLGLGVDAVGVFPGLVPLVRSNIKKKKKNFE